MARRLISATRMVRLLAVTGILLVVVATLWLATTRAGAFFEPAVSVEVVEDFILSLGAWGVAGSLALMVIHSFVPFPSEFVAFANGMVYGPFWGTLLTWTGAMLGAFAAFGLARAFGRPFVETFVARRRLDELDQRVAEHGLYIILLCRFIPVISFNLVNYAAGLTRISWWTFTWTTGLGILPLTTLMVVMGHRIESLTMEAWLMLLIIGVALWWWVRKKSSTRSFRPSGLKGTRSASAVASHEPGDCHGTSTRERG